MLFLFILFFDIIKIDRHVVAQIITPTGFKLLSGIAQFAHHMDMVVVFEGVETEEEKNSAIMAGCDIIQGFYYSRVLPLEEAQVFYEQQK